MGRETRREVAPLLPNEGRALVELRVDMEDGATRTEYPVSLLRGFYKLARKEFN